MRDKPPKILVADDSPANLLALRLEFSDRGYELVEAADGREAMNALEKEKFQAVVTDIWMPGMDGIELVRQIREIDSDLHLFVVTGGGPGLSMASAVTLAQVWGADQVFIKPFDVRALADALDRLID